MCIDTFQRRHMSIALGMILSIVKSFGATISSALLATPPVGVDLEAEQRYSPPFISLKIEMDSPSCLMHTIDLLHKDISCLGWSSAIYASKN